MAFAVLASPACTAPGDEVPVEAEVGSIPPPPTVEGVEPDAPEGGGWERDVTFIGGDPDEPFVLAWHFRASDFGEIQRWERELRLGYAGSWDAVLGDTLHGPAHRTRWRIVPGGPVQLVVGEEDALSTLAFRDGERRIELQLGEFLAEWSRPEGGGMRISRGIGHLQTVLDPEGDVEAGGLILDFTQAREGADAPPPGDWIFLEAGAGTQLFLEALPPQPGGPGPDPSTPGGAGGAPSPSETAGTGSPAGSPGGGAEDRPSRAFRGWSRVAFQAQPWPRIDVTWEETRAFERARRDIPQIWSFASPGGEVEGEVEASSSHLWAGSGEGPFLPVTAHFAVSGEIRVLGEALPVRGVIRHVQR